MLLRAPLCQAGLAVAAVLLGAIFLLTSGGADFAPASPPAATLQQGAVAALGDEQRAEVQAQLAEVQARLAADADDLGSLEAAAVLNARLGNFAEAEQQLSRLTAARPGDAEALRVLAESQAAQAKWGAAAGTYRKAWEAGARSSLEVLQGLAGEAARREGWWVRVLHQAAQRRPFPQHSWSPQAGLRLGCACRAPLPSAP